MGIGLDFYFNAVWMNYGVILQGGMKKVYLGVTGSSSFPLVPESSAGIIPKTIEVSLYKEGNSFGFVLRG